VRFFCLVAETPHISKGMQSLNNYQEKVAN